jgi:hypothetical protein
MIWEGLKAIQQHSTGGTGVLHAAVEKSGRPGAGNIFQNRGIIEYTRDHQIFRLLLEADIIKKKNHAFRIFDPFRDPNKTPDNIG